MGDTAASERQPPSRAAASDSAVLDSEITAQLERVLASETFEKADRLREFLRFLVRESLAGRAALLKEYTIALEVFGRPDTFDPKIDSVVRVAARALRAKLHEYYDTLGRTDALLIELPKGGYVPVYRLTTGVDEGVAAVVASPGGLRSRRRMLVAGAIVLAGIALAARLFLNTDAFGTQDVIVAVLPFESISQASDDAVFCEGLADELTARLASLEGVRVMARTSSRLLKAARDPLAEARKHGVDAMVEGSVTRSGDVVRISAKLVDTSNGYQIWAERYDRVARASFLVQDEIAFSISRALQPRVSPAAAVRSRPPANPEAVRLYWMGRHVRRQAHSDAMPRSAELFEQAVGIDSGYADAWAALADTNAVMAYHQVSGRTPAEYVGRARVAAARALELDPRSAEALVARAMIELYFDRNWNAADRTFGQALQLNPSDYKTRQRYATALLSRGRFDEAVDHSRKAIDLDPLSAAISNDLGVILYIAGRCDESMKLARQALAADPAFSPAHALLGCCYADQEKWTDAIAEFNGAISMSERFSYLLGHLGRACARAGRRAEADALLEELMEAPDQSAISYVHVAYILSGLRDRERALDALERAVSRQDADVSYLAVDPALSELRAQPRFRRLLDVVGLPEVHPAR
jgi:TolB-like protein/Tfp pilus assembly protein PilF